MDDLYPRVGGADRPRAGRAAEGMAQRHFQVGVPEVVISQTLGHDALAGEGDLVRAIGAEQQVRHSAGT